MVNELDVGCHLNVLVPRCSREFLEPALDSLRRHGYRRAVLPPLSVDSDDVAWIAECFRSRGLAPIAMAVQRPGADVSSADLETRVAGTRLLRSCLDAAVAVGADMMTGMPYGLFGRAQTETARSSLDRTAHLVGEIADEAAERGVAMVFEVVNRYETSAINTARQAMEFVAASGSTQLGIHLDVFHMAVEEADIGAAIRLALPRLRYLELGQSGRGMISAGAIDVNEIVSCAVSDGYAGRWGVEAFSRHVLGAQGGDRLAIWRDPFSDSNALLEDAMSVIRRGWSASGGGRHSDRQ